MCTDIWGKTLRAIQSNHTMHKYKYRLGNEKNTSVEKSVTVSNVTVIEKAQIFKKCMVCNEVS